MSARTLDPLTAPWWPELLAIKDTHSYEALARRFGVSVHAVRTGLERAGLGKVPMPRGPKAGASRLAAEAAARAKPAAPVQEAKAPAPVAPPPTPSHTDDPLSAYHDQLGKVADQVIADMTGIPRTKVGEYRRRHNIPAYDGFRTGPRAPRASRAPAPVPAPAPRPAAPVAHVAPVAPPVTVVAERPVAPVAPAPAEVSGSTAPRHGYTVVASKGGQERRFCVTGATLVDAVARAETLLARRTDGPWVLQGVVWVAESLE